MKESSAPGMPARHLPRQLAASLAALLAFAPGLASAATITKAATGTDLAAGASWGGSAPGPGDVATWAAPSLAAGLMLGAPGSWSGILVTSALSAIDVTGAGTLTLGPAGIDLSASSVNLTWGTPIALAASQTWTVNSGRNLTASGVISGPSMVLTKAGSGTLTIKNAANTFSGGTVLNAGQLTVDLQADAALGTGPVTLNGGRLLLQRVAVANALTVNGGDLYPENGFGDSWNGPVTLNANLVIGGPSYATMTFNGSIGGVGGITVNGQGPVVLAVANSYTGPTSVTAATLECRNKDALGSGALSISATANSKVNLNFSGTRNIASLTLGGIPQAGGTYGSTASPATNRNDTYFSGGGTVTVPLSPAKDILSFSFGVLGAAAIGADTVQLDVPIGTDRTALAPTFTLSPGATASPVSGTSRNFTGAQTYTVTAQDGSAKIYTVTVSEAILPNLFTWASATSGNWSVAANWTNEEAIVAAPQAGGRATYTLHFTTAGSYTATHNLNAGFLLNRINLASAVTLAGSNSLAFVSNGATLPQIQQNSGSAATISAPLNLAANLELGGSGGGNVTISGGISGAGSLTKNNAGILTLGGAGSYGGGTTVNTGSLSLGTTANNLLGTGPVTVNSPATLNLNGNNNLTNAFIFNGAIVVNGNSFSANLNGPVTLAGTSTFNLGTTGNMSLGGTVSGAGGFAKTGTGAGPLVLRGANSFTGPVAVQGGTVSVASLNRVTGGTATSNLGAPATEINGTISLGNAASAGTLLYSGPGETTDRVIRLAGSTGGAVLSQTGTPAGIPSTRGDSGLLKFTSAVSIPGSAGVDNRKTLTLTHVETPLTGTNPGHGEISGSIGDSLAGTTGQRATSITKAGTGTWTLSGPNTYSGSTRVQAGTLAVTRADALGGGAVDLTTGARLRLDFIGTRPISALTYNAGAALPNGSYGSSASPAANQDDTRFSGPGTLTVGPAGSPTTTTLARTGGTEPSNGGVAVTFTATVTGTAPGGSVAFYDGLALLGSSPLDGSLQASFTTAALGGGVHAITAYHGGGAGSAPSSSAALVQTVVETRTPTTLTLASGSGSNPSRQWRPVTFTATVAGGVPGGSVTFHAGGTVLGSAPLNGSGQASLTTASLPVGWSAVTARYAGDSTHAPAASAAPLFQAVNPPAGNGKLKVFILAGQSNMQGKGRVETGRDPNNLTNTNFAGGLGSLRHILNRNPSRYGYLADPANPVAGGNPGWITRADVGVTYWSDPGTGENRRGNLDANFGDTGGQGRIGPEYAFGLQVGSQLGDPVLLIKYAFGGKSLMVDFRPPSSGGTVGPYYTGLVARVNQVLASLSTYYPAYTGGGYEIAGFAWHQGWNDRTAINAAEYEVNLTHLIKDLRTQFGVPNLPVVVANTGMANANSSTDALTLIAAQGNVANPARHPEFAGTVTTVDTRPFDFGELIGMSSEGYHWNWNAESYFNIGESMGKAMVALLPAVTSTPFSAWAADPAQGLTAGDNDGPNDDPDRDGITNLLEFVLHGNPIVSSQAALPVLGKSTGSWVFAYDRSVASRPPGTTQVVEYGDTLSGWTQVTIPAGNATHVTVTPQGETDRVEVILPALGARGFARLKVTQQP